MSNIIRESHPEADNLVSDFITKANNEDASCHDIASLEKIVSKLGHHNSSLCEFFSRVISEGNFVAYKNVTCTIMRPSFNDIMAAAELNPKKGEPCIFEHMLDNFPYCDYINEERAYTAPFAIACEHHPVHVIKKAFTIFDKQMNNAKNENIKDLKEIIIRLALKLASTNDNITLFDYLLDQLANVTSEEHVVSLIDKNEISLNTIPSFRKIKNRQCVNSLTKRATDPSQYNNFSYLMKTHPNYYFEEAAEASGRDNLSNLLIHIVKLKKHKLLRKIIETHNAEPVFVHTTEAEDVTKSFINAYSSTPIEMLQNKSVNLSPYWKGKILAIV